MTDRRDKAGRIEPVQPLPPQPGELETTDRHALHHFEALEVNASRGERPSREAIAGLRIHIARLKELGSARAEHWEAEVARIRPEFDSWGIPFPWEAA